MYNNTSDRDRVKTSSSCASDDARGPADHDDVTRSRQGRFVMGLAAGTMIGVGVGLWLAPRASTLRQRLDDSARTLGARVSERYEQAGSRVAAAVDGLAISAQDVRNGVADTLARGAVEVERLAVAAKR